jgi:hypothetical protein
VILAEPGLQRTDQDLEHCREDLRVALAVPAQHRLRHLLDELVRQLVERREQRLPGGFGRHDLGAQRQRRRHMGMAVAPEVVHGLLADLARPLQVAALEQ